MFAYNRWAGKGRMELGMGNGPGERDWTFEDTREYTVRMLYAYVGNVVTTTTPAVAPSTTKATTTKATTKATTTKAPTTKATTTKASTTTSAAACPSHAVNASMLFAYGLLEGDEADWQLAYELELPVRDAVDAEDGPAYAYDATSYISAGSFDRAAYLMILDGEWVWVSFNPWSRYSQALKLPLTQDAGLGIDSTDRVADLTVRSCKAFTGDHLEGRFEMYPNCYRKGSDGRFNAFDRVNTNDEFCYGAFQAFALPDDDSEVVIC